MNDANKDWIEMTVLPREYKLHYLLRKNSNPIFEKDICNKYEQHIYDYYNLIEGLTKLLTERKHLINSYFEMQHKLVTANDFYRANLFPRIRGEIIYVHRKIQGNKAIILHNWSTYNTILNKYIVKYV